MINPSVQDRSAWKYGNVLVSFFRSRFQQFEQISLLSCSTNLFFKTHRCEYSGRQLHKCYHCNMSLITTRRALPGRTWKLQRFGLVWRWKFRCPVIRIPLPGFLRILRFSVGWVPAHDMGKENEKETEDETETVGNSRISSSPKKHISDIILFSFLK